VGTPEDALTSCSVVALAAADIRIGITPENQIIFNQI
jgi:hypothetical protein